MIRYLLLFLLTLYFPSALAQDGSVEPRTLPRSPTQFYAGYGIFSYYKLENPDLYTGTRSTGFVFGGLNFNLTEKYSFGIFAGAEKLSPYISNSSQNYSILRICGMSRINMILAERRNTSLYVSALAGISRENRSLIEETKISLNPAFSLVFLGLRYKISDRMGLFFETSYGDVSVFNLGIAF
jgi:hypothetical protein